jgi:hypothetical protein
MVYDWRPEFDYRFFPLSCVWFIHCIPYAAHGISHHILPFYRGFHFSLSRLYACLFPEPVKYLNRWY